MCLSWHPIKQALSTTLVHHLCPGHLPSPISPSTFQFTPNLPNLWPCGCLPLLIISLLCPLLPTSPLSYSLSGFDLFSFCLDTLCIYCQLYCHLYHLGSGSLPDERSSHWLHPTLPTAPARMCLHTGFQPLHFSRNQGLLINPGWSLLWNIPESWNKPKGLLNSQQGKMPFNWLGWLHHKNLSSCYAKLETNLLDCLRNLPAHPDQNLLRRRVRPAHK